MSWGQFWPLSGKFLPRVSYAFFAGKFLPSVRDSLIRWAYTLSWAPYLRANWRHSHGWPPYLRATGRHNYISFGNLGFLYWAHTPVGRHTLGQTGDIVTTGRHTLGLLAAILAFYLGA